MRHGSQLFPQLAGIHPPHVKQQALDLLAAGLNDCEVSRYSESRADSRLAAADLRIEARFHERDVPALLARLETDPVHGRALRGAMAIYLGDGCISFHPRTQRLRLHLDTRYPEINREVEDLLRRCFPHNETTRVRPARALVRAL